MSRAEELDRSCWCKHSRHTEDGSCEYPYCHNAGQEALSNSGGSDSAETHVATPSEQSIELKRLKDLWYDMHKDLAGWPYFETQIKKLVDKATREFAIKELVTVYNNLIRLDITGQAKWDVDDRIKQLKEELSNKEGE